MSTTQPIRDMETLQNFKQYYLTVSPNPRNHTLCILALNTALRITDVLNLKWKDVWNYEKNIFKTHLDIVEKKTGKESKIVINSAAAEALMDLLKTFSELPLDETYIFCGKKCIAAVESQSSISYCETSC